MPRGRHLVPNPLWNAALRLADAVARIAPARRDPSPRSVPARVLVCIGGHLGDAVIATSVLPAIRQALPHAEIGFLAPSWTAPVLQGHPSIHTLHHVDHWKLRRDAASLPVRVGQYVRASRRVVRELRDRRYDVAIDLYPFYPNSALLLWRARIPTRVGFVTGGLGPLFTSAHGWSGEDRHIAERQHDLLRLAGIAAGDAPAYDLPPVHADAAAAVERRRTAAGVQADEYVVIQMGGGAAWKEWPVEFWGEIARALTARGWPVILTGTGERAMERSRALVEAVPGVVDWCGTQAWDEFRATIARARLVLSVDTVAAHLAAGHRRPLVVLLAAIVDPALWRPLGPTVAVLCERAVPAADAAGGSGSSGSFRGISPADVLNAASGLLEE